MSTASALDASPTAALQPSLAPNRPAPRPRRDRLGALQLVLLVAAAASVAGLGIVWVEGARGASLGRIAFADTSFDVGVSLDRATSVLLSVVVGVAALVVSFARRQYDPGPSTDRFASATALLVTALACTVTATSLPLIAAGWTAAGVAAVLLLAHRRVDPVWPMARHVARRLIVGDALLWLAVATAAVAFTDLDRAALAAEAAAAPAVTVTAIAILVTGAGALRSALVPCHRWLAETTAAATPVSALLHAGFVNGLGVLVILCWPLFAAAGAARVLLVALGLTTILVTSAQRQARPDVKGRLVTSTSSQMGYLAVQAGIGVPAAALAHLVGHALYKASLFLGAGSALRHHVDPARSLPRAAWGAAAALVGATLVALVVLGAVPYPLPAAVVLLSVAGAAATPALATALAAPLPTARRLALGSSVLGVLVAAALVTAWFDRSLHDVLPTWDGWMPWSATVAVGLTAVTISAVAAVDRAVRAGHLRRLQAWAVRSALPARSARWRPGGRLTLVPWAHTPPVSPARRAEVRVLAAEAASAVGATYPLTDFVASNPLAGLEHLPFPEAVRRASAIRHTAGFLPLDTYRDLAAEGQIERGALRRALEDAPLRPASTVSVGGRTMSELEAATVLLDGTRRADLVDAVTDRLAALGPAPATSTHGPALAIATLGERIDDALGTAIAETVDAESSAWVAAFTDRSTMRWALPERAYGLWASWRSTAAGPGADRALGVDGFADAVATLPDRSDEAVAVLLDALAVPPGAEVDELARSLARVAGWSGHLQWAAAHGGSGPLDLLAIRLTLEWALAAAVVGQTSFTSLPLVRAELAARSDAVSTERTGLGELAGDLATLATTAGCTTTDVAGWPHADLAGAIDLVTRFDEFERAGVWQRALEETYRGPVLEQVAASVRADRSATDSRPDRQVVVCIDVRSEPLRRHLEAQIGTETVGFAGFFGAPFSYLPFGASEPRDQCPVLLRPRNVVADIVPDSADHDRAVIQQRTLDAAQTAEHRVEDLPLAPLAFAEPAGWVLAADAGVRTAAPVLAAQAHGLLRDRASRQPRRADVSSGFTLDERVFLAEQALRTMGLTRRFARLILLCGHGSTTENNPFAAGYQCGACGGHDGAPNARVACAILDDPEVRGRLAALGIVIPEDTWFTPGLHDTATDRIHLLEPELVPDTHRQDLDDLRRVVNAAGRSTADERARRLPFDRCGTPADLGPAEATRRAERRARDWAETRPEWGLAGNATFIAGPRRITADLDLGGRSFLHSYEPDDDADGRALETILTAPLVVAQWINSQYYFSAVDPEGFGAGDKVVHNVIAGIGVVSGPRGDLRIGLPRQALFDATGGRVHLPLRLQAIVVAPPRRVAELVDRHEILSRLIGGGWIELAVIDPKGAELVRWGAGVLDHDLSTGARLAPSAVSGTVTLAPGVLDEPTETHHHEATNEEGVRT